LPVMLKGFSFVYLVQLLCSSAQMIRISSGLLYWEHMRLVWGM